MKKILQLFLSFSLILAVLCTSTHGMAQTYLLPTAQTETESSTPQTDALSIRAPSAVLMEASTGTILYEKDSHIARPPASITKIMTLTLIFEAIEQGKLALDTPITVSEHAASMGGSQVFLEPGEIQTVNDMIKCISIASANDACVAMAEAIAGSEEAFVVKMNEKAKALGMNETNFVNCCGLDVDSHMASANDVALMTRELALKHPQIHDYCTIWMDTITHITAKGSSEFGLANTNKLIRQYPYATGLKTGSTSLAKFCVAATAEKDGLSLIAVIMGADDSKARFSDAISLFNYGFSVCQFYQDDNNDPLPNLSVTGSLKKEVSLTYKSPFFYLDCKGSDLNSIQKNLSLPDSVSAPVKKGEKAGSANYVLDSQEIGSVDILYGESIEKAAYLDYYKKVLFDFF